MFHPARPFETWSTEASRRARAYGSLYVVDAVAIRPILVVAAATAVRTVNGSNCPDARNSPVPMATEPSARKIESNLAASASCASRT